VTLLQTVLSKWCSAAMRNMHALPPSTMDVLFTETAKAKVGAYWESRPCVLGFIKGSFESDAPETARRSLPLRPSRAFAPPTPPFGPTAPLAAPPAAAPWVNESPGRRAVGVLPAADEQPMPGIPPAVYEEGRSDVALVCRDVAAYAHVVDVIARDDNYLRPLFMQRETLQQQLAVDAQKSDLELTVVKELAAEGDQVESANGLVVLFAQGVQVLLLVSPSPPPCDCARGARQRVVHHPAGLFRKTSAALCSTLKRWNPVWARSAIEDDPDLNLSSTSLAACRDAWQSELCRTGSLVALARQVDSLFFGFLCPTQGGWG